MELKKSLLPSLFLVLFYCGVSFGQQDAQYTQYMYNTMSVNPAYAGSRGQLSAALLYRKQWLGLDGAPTTQTFNLHSPIRDSRVGYGISIVNDNIGDGIVNQTYIDAAASYTIDVSLEGKLSFGLNLGVNLFNLDISRLEQREGLVETVDRDNIENRVSPNFGLGIYYHTNKFYAGISLPKILQTEHFDGSTNDANEINVLAQEKMNLYLITGFVFDIGGNTKFKPAILSKIVTGAPLQLDFSGTFLFNDKFSLGAAYRWDAAVSAMAGFQISDKFMIGLAYDKETTEFGATTFNDGSLELFLRFELVRTLNKLVSPRFF